MAANEVAFFLGAGISVPAGLPSWKELISRLAERSSAYRDRAKDLGEIAAPDAALLLYRDDEHNFRASLAEALKSPVHALGHALVASMRPAEVISTNFDDLFEQAAASTYEESLTVLWTVSVPASWDPLSIIQVAAGSGRRLHKSVTIRRSTTRPPLSSPNKPAPRSPQRGASTGQPFDGGLIVADARVHNVLLTTWRNAVDNR